MIEVVTLVRDFVRKRLHQPDWREEIVQETLLSIHRGRHTYDPERPFCPWMYGIARHRLSDHVEMQRRRNRTELLTNTEVEELASPEVSVEGEGSAGFLDQALAHLSKTQREVIQMLKLEGFSVAEISKRTGLTASTVKVTAHRGYKKLRALIGEPS